MYHKNNIPHRVTVTLVFCHYLFCFEMIAFNIWDVFVGTRAVTPGRRAGSAITTEVCRTNAVSGHVTSRFTAGRFESTHACGRESIEVVIEGAAAVK